MVDCWHHAVSSSKKWGGAPEEYVKIHQWFDESKYHLADFRHRMLRHHAEGIGMSLQVFGPVLNLSTGRVIPIRYIGEQHVMEDLGTIPSFVDWARAVRPAQWMDRVPLLREMSKDLSK